MKLQKSGSPRIEEPRKGKAEPKKRFLIVKLEERIAPACYYNPHDKLVGCPFKHRYCI